MMELIDEPKIRVVLADDHAVLRAGLKALLNAEPDIEVVGEAADGAEALARVERLGADVVLMDLRMPEMGGVEAIQRLRETAPSVRAWCSPPTTPTATCCPRSRPAPPVTC